MKTIFYFILIFIYVVSAEYHMTFILLTAPKKIPMLTYTIEYFIHAYEYSKGDIVIDGFFLGKGCDCDHPEYDEAIKLMNSKGIPTYGVPFNTDIQNVESEKVKHLLNYYSSLYHDLRNHHHGGIEFDKFLHLYSPVTDFFDQLIEGMDNVCKTYDHVLFLENDIAFPKNFFERITNEFNKHVENEMMMKIAYPSYLRFPEVHLKLPRRECPWGFWGIIFTREKVNMYKKYSHYLRLAFTGDLYHCELYLSYDQSIRMLDIIYHFGKDSNIQPRDPRFWN